MSDPLPSSWQYLPGLLNLFGIESPGLTASLAIGEYVGERVAALAH